MVDMGDVFMTKNLKEYSQIKEKKTKTDEQLLKFMEYNRTYTTSNVQEYLKINHTATLQRLKKLAKQGYLRLIEDRIYRWEKIKDKEQKESYEGYYFC